MYQIIGKKLKVIRMASVVAMLIISVALSSCKSNGTEDYDTSIINNPNSAQGYDASAKLPAITFERDLYDFGRLTAGENISYSFKFKNTGNADLVISGCDATCGCTVADYPKKHIKPGEEGYITVTFNSASKSGQQFQEVTVNANTQPSRTKLHIKAVVTAR